MLNYSATFNYSKKLHSFKTLNYSNKSSCSNTFSYSELKERSLAASEEE
jgi:hypothetical protein